MLKREILFRRVALALCAVFVCSALAFSPGVVRAKAMPDGEFLELCGYGTADEVRQALKDGANPNARDDPGGDDASGTTALMMAANSGDVGKVKVLLSAGADVNARDKEGMTALMRLLTSALTTAGDPDVAEVLISAGADVNATDDNGMTPLMLAAGRGNGEMGSLLLSSGADKSLKDKDGHDALWHARNPMFVPCEECMADFVRQLEGGGKKKPARRRR